MYTNFMCMYVYLYGYVWHLFAEENVLLNLPTAKICLFENGVNLDDHSGEFGANCVNGTITSQTDTSVELSLNYGSNGCENVSVDEVSFWSEALEMSDLMALRIQPFNSSCELEFTPYGN